MNFGAEGRRDQAGGGEASASEGLRDVPARQHREPSAPGPPPGRRRTAGPGRDREACCRCPPRLPPPAHRQTTRRGRRAPREPRKEGTPGWTRKRRRGGQGPHAPDPRLRGQGTDVKPRPRVATQAGTSKPPPRHSPWRAASKPFPEGQSPKHDPKQTRWTHRAPGVTPAPLAAEAGGARGRDP